MKTNKKGFTLIELIISLSILTIVLGLIYSVFLSSQKNINKVEAKSDLQQEAQQILQYINQGGMEAEKVVVTSEGSRYTILFTTDKRQNGSVEEYKFILDNNANELRYSSSKIENKLIGKYIKNIRVNTIIQGETLENCSALKINIYLSKKGTNNENYDYEVMTNVYFRNK